jgi:hypothetical protein
VSIIAISYIIGEGVGLVSAQGDQGKCVQSVADNSEWQIVGSNVECYSNCAQSITLSKDAWCESEEHGNKEQQCSEGSEAWNFRDSSIHNCPDRTSTYYQPRTTFPNLLLPSFSLTRGGTPTEPTEKGVPEVLNQKKNHQLS